MDTGMPPAGSHRGAAGGAFLGVSESATGRSWSGPDESERRIGEAIAQRLGAPLPLGLVLARRGVAPDDAAGYLSPRIRDLMPDPRSLPGAREAAEILVEAARKRRRVAVFADYDVDGAASAALMIEWLRHFGIEPTLYVPDRLTEGYGPNPEAMRRLAREHELIITVDCGTLAHDALAAAAPVPVVVLDHHAGAGARPPAAAVVNPNLDATGGPLGTLAAAGVVFMVLVEANRQLRGTGLDGPDLMAMLDLVALATVADVVPLVGLNRAFVRQGLKILASRARPGLAALADAARLDRPPEARHLGFVLGPRINAGGRIGRPDLGARLLSGRDPDELRAIAARLERLNAERQRIEQAVLDEARARIEARGGPDGPLAWAAGEGWHPGVIGIVAARLKERFERPAVVIALEGERGTGSGRGVVGGDLGAAVIRLAEEGLIERGGGHPMAAGLTLARGRLVPAMERLAEILAAQGVEAARRRPLRLDAALGLGATDAALCRALDQAGPFGAGAPAPRFAWPALRLIQLREVGAGHLMLRLRDAEGRRIDAAAFRAAGTALGDFLAARVGALVHVAGRPERDEWQGRERVRILLDDAAAPA